MDNRFVIIEKRHLPILWTNENGVTRPFHRVREFDCRVVSLENKYGGGFLTVIPISPLEYREEHGTSKAKVDIENTKYYTEFIINDDWGAQHIVSIPKTMKKEIRIATKAAIIAKLV